MDNPVNIWHLMARVLNGEASGKEQQELIELLRQDESLQQQYDLLTRIWKEKEAGAGYHEGERESARNTISRIINKVELTAGQIEPAAGTSRIRKRAIWLAAASVLILISAGWVWIINRPSSIKAIAQEAIEARKGSHTKSLLPDGTTVWLNAGSKLFYDGDLNGSTRDVRLEGEAFFDVVISPRSSSDGSMVNRPFIVHTSGIDIKVLGTAFNVKSYPEDKAVETTLYRGSVKVFREEESEAKAIQLKPNEKLILPKQAAIRTEEVSKEMKPSSSRQISPANFTIAHIDSTKKENERFETAWLYSRLEIRGDNFEEMAKKLERWYNVTIVFSDEKVKELSFTGTFENENVEQAFAALKIANNRFKYKINNHEISVGSAE
jgi:transmembrane sensor